MNAGRDPDDLREPTLADVGLWRARWFRATVVFSVVAMMAAFAVPYAVGHESARGLAGGLPPRFSHAGAIPGVAAPAWEGRATAVLKPARHGARAEGPTTRGPSILRVSASAPAAPKSPEPRPSKGAKGAPGSQPQQTEVSPRAADVYWLQVGAFRDAQTAKRIAQRLREQKYHVHESVTARQAGGSERAAARGTAPAKEERDRYEVVVTGASAGDVEAKLTAKGLTSRAATEGAVVTPGLPLGEAVALSRDLSTDGLAVRVRRVGTPAGAAARSSSSAESETLHRVRVGAFTDRAAAEAALKELESRGYRPVLTRGNE